MFELNSLYQREVFFAGKFEGNKSLLFQAIGNYGAYARDADFQKDISLVIISNKVLKDFEEGIIDPFIPELENKLNQNLFLKIILSGISKIGLTKQKMN